MRGKSTHTRRGFLKKVANTAVATSIVGTAVSGNALGANGETHLTISERTGHRVEYNILVNDPYMEMGKLANPGADTVRNYPDIGRSRAIGFVKGGSDDYWFPGQILGIVLNSHNSDANTNIEPAGDVGILCQDGWGYTGTAKIDIWTEEQRLGDSADYEFCVKDGKVRQPGDGTLEDEDEAGNDILSGLDDNCGKGLVNGSHDHYDTEGRLRRLDVELGKKYKFHFTRTLGERW